MAQNLIEIKNYSVPHGSGQNGGGGGNTYITYNGTSERDTSRYVGNRSFQNIDGDSCQFTYIMAGEGQIQKLSGDELNYNFGYIGELESDSIKAGKVDTDELNAVKGFIENLDCKKITTEYLTVTKQAHFFELIIDKVRAVGGQIILTPAQCTIDRVYAYNLQGTLIDNPIDNYNSVSYFDVWWRKDDELNRSTTNDWIVNDQALCQSFNIEAGTHHNVANKYYWRLVKYVYPNTRYINFYTNEYVENTPDNPLVALTDKNNISISMMPTYGSGIENGITWNVDSEDLQVVTWDDVSSQTYAVNGVMHTKSIEKGIEILPSGDYTTLITSNLDFVIKNADGNIPQTDIKIGVEFTDGTSLYYIIDKSSYVSIEPNDPNYCKVKTLNLDNPNVAIKEIRIICTQPVQWHECYGIRLGNDNSNGRNEVDQIVSVKGAVPEEGDTIVQLGYRGTENDPDFKRTSAIIIAAYHTPDADLTAPSYAQYMGINDFHLREHRGSYIDANGAQFLGDIRLAKIGTDNQGNVITMSELVVDVNGIKSRVIATENELSSFESSITQTANNISLRVTATENGIVAANSEINVLSDRISSEVTARRDADSVLSSSITQTASDIRTEVSQNYVSNSTLDSYDYADKSYVDQTASSITSTVERTYVTQSDFNSDINSLEGDINSISRNYVQKTQMSQYYDSWQIAAMQEDIDSANQIIQAAIEVNANGRIILKSAETDIRDANSTNGGILRMQNYGGTTTMQLVGGNGSLQTMNSGDGSEVRLNHSSIRFESGSNYIEIGLNSSGNPYINTNGTFSINASEAIRLDQTIYSSAWPVQSGSSITSSTKRGRLTAPSSSSDNRMCFHQE